MYMKEQLIQEESVTETIKNVMNSVRLKFKKYCQPGNFFVSVLFKIKFIGGDID